MTDAEVPAPLIEQFLKAQNYVERYFDKKRETPEKGVIDISGERYILVRAASMSKEFFDLMTSFYRTFNTPDSAVAGNFCSHNFNPLNSITN